MAGPVRERDTDAPDLERRLGCSQPNGANGWKGYLLVCGETGRYR